MRPGKKRKQQVDLCLRFCLRFMKIVEWGREASDEDPEPVVGVAGRGGGMP